MLAPTLYVLGAFTLVVLTKDLPGFIDLIVNRGAGLGSVAWIVLLQAQPVMMQMLPFAVLVGCLTGLGRLSSDLEILALSALGMDPRRLAAPVVVFGLGIALLALVMTLKIAPLAERELAVSLQEISEVHPTAEIVAGNVQRFGDWKLQARDVSADGEMLGRVTLWIPSVGETIFAQTAAMRGKSESDLEIVLKKGALLLDTGENSRSIHFDELRASIPQEQRVAGSSLEDRLKAESLSTLFGRLNDSGNQDESRKALSEVHRRFTLPSAAALFGLIALPLAMARSKPSRSRGVVTGLIVTVAYYGITQFAEGVAQRNPDLTSLAAWLPNAALLIFAALLYANLARSSAARESSALAGIRRRGRPKGATGPIREIDARKWALPRYVAASFLLLTVLCFSTLVIAYTLVDILERLDWFARHGASVDTIARFYSARIPLLVSRVAPMGLVVAMALTVSLLTSTGELVAMRSLGISARQALRPALLVCILLTPASFLLNDQLVQRTNEIADLIKRRDIKNKGDLRTSVWGTSGQTLFQIDRLDTARGEASGIVVYDLLPDGIPESRIDAQSAIYVGEGQWKLSDATGGKLNTSGGLESVKPPPYAELGESPSDEVDLTYLSVSELLTRIRELSAAGDVATFYEVDLHAKLATPLTCLLLPMLIMTLAVSGPPFPKTAQTLVFAGGIAVSYTLLAGSFASFGRGGIVPPWVGGWGPSLIVTVALIGLAWRNRVVRGGSG